MDGIHDLGGKHGFGQIVREPNGPAFHERWEAVVFALSGAVGTAGAMRNVDQFRHAVERIDPVAYLDHGYYGRWLGGIENLLVEAGLLTQREIDDRVQRSGGTVGRVAARPSSAPDRVDYAPEGLGGAAATLHRTEVQCWRCGGHAGCALRRPHPSARLRPGQARRGDRLARGLDLSRCQRPRRGRAAHPPLHHFLPRPRRFGVAGAEPATSVSLDLFEPYLKKAVKP